MASIIIRIGTTTRKFAAADLNAECATSLAEELADELDCPLEIEVKRLADFPEEGQQALWMLYQTIKGQRTVTLRQNKKTYAKPLELALAQLVGGDDPEVFEWRLRAATTAVAACYSSNAQGLCIEGLIKKLKELGVTSLTPTMLKKMVKGGS